MPPARPSIARTGARSLVLVLLLLGIADEARADEGPFLSCDQKQPATWSTPATDPVADVSKLLIDNGYDNASVLAVRQELFEGDPQKPVCKAIVETSNRGNFVYFFHYAADETGQWHLAGEGSMPLYDKLPPDVSFSTLGPYGPAAETEINVYGRILMEARDCAARPPGWRDQLSKTVQAAIPAERGDLLASSQHFPDDGNGPPLLGDLAPTKSECRSTDFRKDFAFGDAVIAGRQTVWDTPPE